MADEKLNVSPEENPQPSLFDAGPEGAPAQDAPAPEPPAPENAPVSTSRQLICSLKDRQRNKKNENEGSRHGKTN